jgi:uncharacterized protein YyaL (SSP411 family)
MTAASQSNQPNRLIHETSPYLLQHAHNPVDWYPWGPEALGRAAAEDKPILLSVGYSACHWCHVMAHESFEDPDTAALMNELFVNVKVDREERPDIDAIYMEAVQAMTGRGGWPMTVFLAPDGRPFYGGTYYPSEPRYGMPSFRQLLRAIAEAWQERRREMESAGDRMADALNRSAALRPADTALAAGVLDKAAQNLMRSLDPYEGGFSDAPKFPQPMNLDFLLQNWRRTGDEKQRKAVTYTLAKMARGGIYDQLGGGFHRYSTDAHWLVPHFEKMLYDNAQLARTYLHAWQITGEPELRQVVEETLDYVLREMTARSGGLAEGGFFSTQDADSEGVEGKFFVWTPDEVLALLGPNDGPLFSAYFDVTARGNFHEGGHSTNILHAEDDLEDAAGKLKVSEERLADVIARGRKILYEARERRVHPGRDEKILAEWNGLMIHALAEAGAALERPDYIQAAVRAAEFILAKLIVPEVSNAPHSTLHAPRLFRTYNAGRAHLNAYLEDYASVALGLAALYEATFELRWLRAAAALAQTILTEFRDADGAGFFQVSANHEKLVVRRKDFIDSAIPSGNSLAAELMLRLAVLLGDDTAVYRGHAEGILRLMADGMGEQPLAFGRLLCALDLYLNPGHEIAIVGDPAASDTRALLAEVRRRYLPNSILALATPGNRAASELIPLLADRGQVGGRATAYVCRSFVCNLPVNEPEALAAQLT